MLAYTRYVLDAGMRGDLLALQVALAPCVIGYAENGHELTVARCPFSVTSGSEADAITSKALNDFVQSVLDEVEALPLARIPDRFS